MSNPTFSVLTSAYQAEDFIGEAIESILGQTTPSLELLVFDDGSDDGTSDVVRSFDDPRIRLWRQPNGGKSAALNFMLKEARGEYIVIQDADDLSRSDRLARLAEEFKQRPELHAVMSGHALRIGRRTVAPRGEDKSPERCRAEVLAGRQPAHDPTLACRTETARALGFEESLRVGVGFDFVLRLGETRPMAVIGESLYLYRVNETSITRTKLDRRAAGVRQVFDRRRARHGLPPLTDAEFARVYGAGDDPTNNLLGHFVDSAWLQVAAGRRLGALHTAAESLRAVPLSVASAKPLIYALAPRAVGQRIRSRSQAARERMAMEIL